MSAHEDTPARDLFGDVIAGPANPPPPGGRKPTRPKGYAAPPGSRPGGAQGETCKTCLHYARVQHGNVYRKCALMRNAWTHGTGSDILASSPACLHWKPNDEPRQQPPAP